MVYELVAWARAWHPLGCSWVPLPAVRGRLKILGLGTGGPGIPLPCLGCHAGVSSQRRQIVVGTLTLVGALTVAVAGGFGPCSAPPGRCAHSRFLLQVRVPLVSSLPCSWRGAWHLPRPFFVA